MYILIAGALQNLISVHAAAQCYSLIEILNHLITENKTSKIDHSTRHLKRQPILYRETCVSPSVRPWSVRENPLTLEHHGIF